MQKYFDNLDYTTLLTGVGIGVTMVLLIPPLVGMISSWFSSKDTKDSDTTSENIIDSSASSVISTEENVSEKESTESENIIDSSASSVISTEENVSEKESTESENQSIASDNEVSRSEVSGSENLDFDPDTVVMDTLTNPNFGDAFLINIRPIFTMESIQDQIDGLAFLMPYLHQLNKNNYDMFTEWWNNTMALELDAQNVALMHEILINFNQLMSQL